MRLKKGFKTRFRLKKPLSERKPFRDRKLLHAGGLKRRFPARTMARLIRHMSRQERINFLFTNRVPRRLLTHWIGWYSQIENPLLTKASIKIWKLFADDLDFEDTEQRTFSSLNDCFTRGLKEGARPIDEREQIVVSPCDAIIGAHGHIDGTTVYQAKGFPYELGDLIPDASLQEKYRDGVYITLRLKSSMYHRFHAPVYCHVREISYISGDAWNVNPIALQRVEKLYCKNERAVIQLHMTHSEASITLVPVAAILVASMRFHALDHDLNLRYRGPNALPCNASYAKGEEMGYFQHGSTIILFATSHYTFCDHVVDGHRIRMGEPLLAISSSM